MEIRKQIYSGGVMIGASKIPNDIREMANSLYNGFCATEECVSKDIQLHHRMPNTIANVKKYSLFINSIFNLIPLCYNCHLNKSLRQWRVTDKQARLYEEYLTSVKKG